MEERAKVKERNGRKGHDDRMTREMEEAGEYSCNEPSLCAAGMCGRQSR